MRDYLLHCFQFDALIRTVQLLLKFIYFAPQIVVFEVCHYTLDLKKKLRFSLKIVPFMQNTFEFA